MRTLILLTVSPNIGGVLCSAPTLYLHTQSSPEPQLNAASGDDFIAFNSNQNYSIIDWPDISAGCSIPRIFSIVGAISASLPPLLSVQG